MTAGAHKAHVLGMRGMLFGLLVLAGCMSPDPVIGPVGRWEYIDSAGQTGVAMRFDEGGTYQADVMTLASQSSANDQRTSGTWQADATTVVLTPTESTCTETAPSVLHWRRAGDDLVIGTPPQIDVILAPLPAATSPGFTGAVLAFGCFVNGTWVPAQ